MLDLFLPPKIRPPVANRVNRIAKAKEVASDRAQSPRAEYYREYHIQNRAARLAAMKDNYKAKKPEYVARARKWRKKNKERYREVQNKSQVRRRRRNGVLLAMAAL